MTTFHLFDSIYWHFSGIDTILGCDIFFSDIFYQPFGGTLAEFLKF